MITKIAWACLVALAVTASNTAMARTPYDGTWSLIFLTQRGGCDRSYNFTVQIQNGIVSHPNLVKFKGRVSPGGKVRASVSVPGKYASGTGRMTRTAGQGRWAGYAGSDRCSGTWSAQRF